MPLYRKSNYYFAVTADDEKRAYQRTLLTMRAAAAVCAELKLPAECIEASARTFESSLYSLGHQRERDQEVERDSMVAALCAASIPAEVADTYLWKSRFEEGLFFVSTDEIRRRFDALPADLRAEFVAW